VARLGRNFWLGAAVLALLGLFFAARASRSDRAGAPPVAAAAEREPAPVAIEAPAAVAEIPPERALRGIVRDAFGAVPGALVTAADRYDGSELAKARTAEDGTFVLGPVEDFVRVVAEHAERGVAADDGRPGDSLELWLLPGATVSGTVRARDGGRPLGGASVHVGRVVVTADAEGRYALRNVPGGRLTGITAVAHGHRQARRWVPIAAGEARILDFLLERGMTLGGVVTDAGTGAPIEGAQVAEHADRFGILGTPWPADRRTVTDGQGRYLLEGVAADANHTFVCCAAGYVAAERESNASGRLDFALGRPLAAEGLVVDPDGRPVPGAVVYLHRVRETAGSVFRGRLRCQRTEADADGRFRFDDIVPGTVAFVAITEGLAPGETAHLDADELRDVVVRLTHGMTLDVTVRDADGLGVAGASLNTQTPTGLGDRVAPIYAGRECLSLRTDEDGRLRLEGVIPGDFGVAAWHRSQGHAYGKVSGRAGETVSLELAFGKFEIAGSILSARREPVAGARVTAFGSNHSESARADSFGRFRVRGLSQGSFRLRALSDVGAAGDAAGVAAGAQGVEIRLASLVTIRGRVRGAQTGPLGAFEVRFLARQANVRCQVEGGDGRFEELVPPGTYDVTARAPGHRPKVIRGVVVQEGPDPPPFEFVLEPAATLRGTARDREGRALPFVVVSVAPTKPEDGIEGTFDKTDQEGRFLLEGLGPATYAVVLHGEREGTTRTLVTIPATGAVSLDLRLGATGTVVARVVDADGKPVSRAYVTFSFPEGGALAGDGRLTDAEGMVVSGPLPADVALAARAEEGDRRAEAKVTVGPGEKAEIRLRLK